MDHYHFEPWEIIGHKLREMVDKQTDLQAKLTKCQKGFFELEAKAVIMKEALEEVQDELYKGSGMIKINSIVKPALAKIKGAK